ncbi:hypothetical protein COT48_05100, partial [Candidatus Woesearchaeota archaeon CG08_land_8_20_14_0_20_47_9]
MEVQNVIISKSIREYCMSKSQELSNKYVVGDCLQILKSVPGNIFDLIVTSPPYADSRKDTQKFVGIAPPFRARTFESENLRF